MKATDRILMKNLANTAELVNTINGGMVEPQAKLYEYEDGWLLKMRVPGVSVESIKIEVRDGILLVFHNLRENQSELELPNLIEMINLTSRIDQQSIYAEYDQGEVLVHLPFDELASGFEREIDIVKR